MNRETQAHFAQIPSMDISRSKFDRSFIHKTTMNAADLVPIYVDPDIVPGDTVTMRMAELVRMTTPIVPVMDELSMDIFWFFVPNRLVWDHFKRFMGENDTAPWTQKSEYTIPQLTMHNIYDNGAGKLYATVEKGSVLDHMGIPTMNSWKKAGTVTEEVTEPNRTINITSLPTKAYCLIWNEFFRSEALQNPVDVPKSDSTATVLNKNSGDYISDPEAATIASEYKGGLPPLKVCKTFDYFTAALPEAQAGPAVTLPMNGTAPINYDLEYHTTADTDGNHWYADSYNNDRVILLNSSSNATDLGGYGYTDSTGFNPTREIGESQPQAIDNLTANALTLAADLSSATGATINALRQAFAVQKFYEREARGGQRYIEMVRSHFNVVNPDFRLQRPEYLGGYRHQITVNQVIQSSETNTTPLGETGAYSLTTHRDGDVFSHSFTEHGILMGLACIRQTQHTYQQGINRAWLKKEKFDFYYPELANLGEQYIKNAEIYAQGIDKDNEAFGYQEAWAEMRYMPDIVSGEMRSDYSQTLDYWHYGDNYEELPKLGSKWIRETDSNILRTLAVQDHDQFKCDFYFGAIYTRPLPTWSVPGLIDHH